MDFLDPQAKRRHLIRLIIGYGLMAVLIGIAAFILLFRAYGFNVDRDTGELIQNGLIYIDSAPDGATIVLNGEKHSHDTNTRLELPAGQYDMQIKKEGYRDWRRSFSLNGGEVERFTYPMLIPATLSRQSIQSFDAKPEFVTESPDRRWAILSQGGSVTEFVEHDLNSLQKSVPESRSFSVPSGIYSRTSGKIELVEWSNDNRHFLVKHSFSGGFEFIVISRDKPESSININRLLGQNPDEVVMRDKKFDQWYIFHQGGGVLQFADAKRRITPLVRNVTNFKSHDTENILYSQFLPDKKTQRISLLRGTDSFVLKDVVSAKVFLDIARYDDSWYVVIGADGEQKTYIYKDPMTVLEKRDGTKPPPLTVLKATGPMTVVSFSNNTRFVMTQSGQHFEVYDAEYSNNYKYDISEKFDSGTKVEWMDGHRLIGRHDSKAIIFDFDGSNLQEMVGSLPGAPILFDRDYTVLYSVDKAQEAGRFSFYTTELRLEGDK